jgi:hypothetical protein
VALLLAFASSVAAAKYQLSVSPRVGGPHTVFVATFASPLADPDGFFSATLRGPGRCREVFDFTDGPVEISKGTRVAIRLDEHSLITNDRIHSKRVHVPGWCVGRYAGTVDFTPTGPEDKAGEPFTLGHIAFRVV